MLSGAKTKILRDNNDSGPILPKRKRLSEALHDQLKWKLWLIGNYEHKTGSTTAIKSIVAFSSSEKANLGNRPLPPEVLGKLVKEIWDGKVMVVRRGSRDNSERHYLHLTRREMKDGDPELPQNWSSISETDKRMSLIRLENFQVNKQRAVTEVTVEEINVGEHKFTIRANGAELDFQSDLDLASDIDLKDMNLRQKMETIVNLVDKSVLCEGYKLPSGGKVSTSLPHHVHSVRDLSKSINTVEEMRVFSADCLIFSNGDIGRRCSNCNNLMFVDHQKKKREETRGTTIHPKCNRRYLEKEDIERQLDDCRREKRKALEREEYWREKFTSQSIELEKEDHEDLSSISNGIDGENVPADMKCFWEQQQKTSLFQK